MPVAAEVCLLAFATTLQRRTSSGAGHSDVAKLPPVNAGINTDMAAKAKVYLVGEDGSKDACNITSHSPNIECLVPLLVSGRYRVQLGVLEGNAAALDIGLTAKPKIMKLNPPAGSIAGGQTVEVSLVGVKIPEAEEVAVYAAGVPCDVKSVVPNSGEGSFQVSCQTRSNIGSVPTTVRSCCLPSVNSKVSYQVVQEVCDHPETFATLCSLYKCVVTKRSAVESSLPTNHLITTEHALSMK